MVNAMNSSARGSVFDPWQDPVLGGVDGVAHFSTSHEQTQLNRVCYFHFFGVFLASKGPIQNLFRYHLQG